MRINFNQTCASHAPILLEFVNQFEPLYCAEFGCGLFSTSILLQKFVQLISIEIGNTDWYHFINSRFGVIENFTLLYYEKFSELAVTALGHNDLIFIDCAEPRYPIVNLAFGIADTIICHDTQLHWTKKIEMPENFKRIDFKKFPVQYKTRRQDAFDQRPWTTLFTNKDEIYNRFKDIEMILYKKYKFPYGVKQ